VSNDFAARPHSFLGSLGPGSQIAGYLIEEQVGAGGMAVVFRARDELLGRLAAVKVIAPAMANDPGFRARFLRESRAAAAVESLHILPVYGAGQADGLLYIASRFVAGGDLAALRRRAGGVLAPARAAALVAQVASALDAAHAAGLVHRDVKPQNILVDALPERSEHAFLADFGLSKETRSSTEQTATEHFMGTPDYCAPELIRAARVDGRTDQYALACVAFVLLTGTLPFHRDESMATLFAQVHDPVPLLTVRRPELPDTVDAVIARALAKSPADRYGRCGEFAAALRDSLAPARPAAAPARPALARPGAANETAAFAAGPGRRPSPVHPARSRRGRVAALNGPGARGSRFRIRTLVLTSGIVALTVAAMAAAANIGGGAPRTAGQPQRTAAPATTVGPPATTAGPPATTAGPPATTTGTPAGTPAAPRPSASSGQSGAPSSGAAPAPHYASQLTGFTPVALVGTWGDGSSWTDKSTIGRTTFADDELTFSYTARHSGVDSALTDGTGDACVRVSDDGISFNEVPMAASPSADATYPDAFSGTMTVAAFMPGTYTLVWGCSNSLYSAESIPIGTLKGTSIRPPQVDDLYGDWIWFITSLDYTSSTTTIHLATISGNGVLQEPGKIWHLADGNRKVAASAQSTVTNVAGQATRTFHGSSKVVYLEITFPTATRGLYLYCDDELSPQIGGAGGLP
jgi:Protein kinase domain